MAKPRLKFHTLILASALAVLVLMAVPPARQVVEQQRQITAEETKLQALLDENARLEERLQRLADQDYLEKLAREQLEMVRPGEISYVVVPPEMEQETQAPHADPKPWYGRAWEWIKGLFGGD